MCPGFCGGFTTISTICIEIQAMIREHFFIEAVLYIVLSVTFGILLVYLGGLIQIKPTARAKVPEQSDVSDISLRLSEHCDQDVRVSASATADYAQDGQSPSPIVPQDAA
jgi:hypothetical protein